MKRSQLFMQNRLQQKQQSQPQQPATAAQGTTVQLQAGQTPPLQHSTTLLLEDGLPILSVAGPGYLRTPNYQLNTLLVEDALKEITSAAQTHATDHDARFSSRTNTYADDYVADSEQWLQDTTKKQEAFAATAAAIDDYLNKYQDYIPAEKQIATRTLLSDLDSMYNQMVTKSRSDNDYWSLWDSEEEYLQTQEVAYLQSLDLEQERKKLTEMETLFDDALTIDSWYNMYIMNPDVWSQEDIDRNLSIYNRLHNGYSSSDDLWDAIIEQRELIEQAAAYQSLQTTNIPVYSYPLEYWEKNWDKEMQETQKLGEELSIMGAVLEDKRQTATDSQKAYYIYTGSNNSTDIPSYEEQQVLLSNYNDLLSTGQAATNDYREYQNEYNEKEDEYNYRTDMLLIAGMTEEERHLLQHVAKDNYHAKQQLLQKYSEEQIENCAQTYERYLGGIRTAKVKQAAKDFVESIPGGELLGSALSVLGNFVNIFTGSASSLGSQLSYDLFGNRRYHTPDPNSVGYLPGVWSDGVREQVYDNLDDKFFWGDMWANGYTTAMGLTDNVTENVLLPATLSTANIFQDSYHNAAKAGLSYDEAMNVSLINMGIDAIPEVLSPEDLLLLLLDDEF